MITLENRFFPTRVAICFVVEGAIILLAVLSSFAILHGGDTGVVTIKDAFYRGVVVAFFCQSCMYMLDLYDLKHSQSWGELAFSLLFSVGIVFIGVGLISYAVPKFGVEGSMYYLTVLFSAIFLMLWRMAFDIYLSRFARKENVLIAGTGEVAEMVAREILERKRLGFHLVGFVAASGSGTVDTGGIAKVFGTYSDLWEIVRRNDIRKLIVAITERRGEYPVAEMLNIRVRGCQVIEWPSFFEKLSGRIPVNSLSPSYFIFNEGFNKNRFVLLSRRVISFGVALISSVVLIPLFLLTGILIKIDSHGPVFYTQERVGKGGRVFRIYKFRSMRQDAEENGGPQWASKDDPRITRVGKVIRLLRIDELPQLFNVMRGDIDIVGPRPERPGFVEKLQREIPYYSLRHTVKPGLTGWAQVMFTYCGTLEESREKLQYDLFYIKNMSVKLDLLILFRTLKIVILGRGAR